MAYEIVSTHFVAHEEDLNDAYELYRARVNASRAEVVAISPRPHPIENDFFLWDLRCEAAYANMPAPEGMQLYELNALVDFVIADRDEAVEDFFFEGPVDPTRYPSTLGGIAELQVRDGLRGSSRSSPWCTSAQRLTRRWRRSFSTICLQTSTPLLSIPPSRRWRVRSRRS